MELKNTITELKKIQQRDSTAYWIKQEKRIRELTDRAAELTQAERKKNEKK